MKTLLRILSQWLLATLAFFLPWIGMVHLGVRFFGKDSLLLIPILLVGLIIGCYFCVNILTKHKKADKNNDGSKPISKRRIEDNSSTT